MSKPSADAIAKIAQVMHETMRAWQKANGQDVAPPWSKAPQWMRASSIDSVSWRIANPKAAVSAQHDQWLAQKKKDGWKHGKVKDGIRKTHPKMVSYNTLPEVERRKDALVNAVVNALAAPMK